MHEDSAFLRSLLTATAHDEAARASLLQARDRHVQLQEHVAEMGSFRRTLQRQLEDLEAETSVRLEQAAIAQSETRAFRNKRKEYASRRREILGALENVDLARIGHLRLLQKRNDVDAAVDRRNELKKALRPYHDLPCDAQEAERKVQEARETLAKLDSDFQRLVAGLDL